MTYEEMNMLLNALNNLQVKNVPAGNVRQLMAIIDFVERKMAEAKETEKETE